MDFKEWLKGFILIKNIKPGLIVKKVDTSYDYLREVLEEGKIPNDQWLYNFAVAFDLDINEIREKAGKPPIEGLPEKRSGGEIGELQEIKEQCKNLNAKIDNLTHIIEQIKIDPFVKSKKKKFMMK